jgi:hypothetical protein
VIEEAKTNFAKATGPTLDPTSAKGKMLQAELEAIQEVMDEAQALINDPNRGFKGFLPAVFAYRVAGRFSQKVGDLAYLKLTAPKELIRRRSNLPDTWEEQMIKSKFSQQEGRKASLSQKRPN